MTIQKEVITFFLACALGGFFSFYYDCFRIIRNLIKHHDLIVFIEDIFYFASSTIILFSFMATQTNGELRGFIFCGIILGFVLYYFTISIIFIKVVNFLYKILFNIIVIIFIPIKLLLMFFHYFYTKIRYFLSIFTKSIKKTTIN